MKPSRQWLRHSVQTLVLLALILAPVLSWYRAETFARIEAPEQVALGPVGGPVVKVLDRATGANEHSSDETDQEPLRFYGNSWSAQLFALSWTDPLGGLEALVTRHATVLKIAAGIWLPILLTILLGRVFCTWLCPAGLLFEVIDKCRSVLQRLGFANRSMPLWRGQKYVLLIVGLIMSAALAVPLLGYFYPPAVLAREVNVAVTDILRWDGNTIAVPFTVAAVFIFVLLLTEVFVSRRLWCRYLCPGGGLFSLLGRFRVVRVRRKPAHCTDCTLCVTACGMGLNPMRDQMGMECDNCMVCVTECPHDALSLGLSWRDKPEAAE